MLVQPKGRRPLSARFALEPKTPNVSRGAGSLRRIFSSRFEDEVDALRRELRLKEEQLAETTAKLQDVQKLRNQRDLEHAKRAEEHIREEVQNDEKVCKACPGLEERITKQKQIVTSLGEEIGLMRKCLARGGASERAAHRSMFDSELQKLKSRVELKSAKDTEARMSSTLMQVADTAQRLMDERVAVAEAKFETDALAVYLDRVNQKAREREHAHESNREVLVDVLRTCGERQKSEGDIEEGMQQVAGAVQIYDEVIRRVEVLKRLLDKAMHLWLLHAKNYQSLEPVQRSRTKAQIASSGLHPMNLIKSSRETIQSVDSKLTAHKKSHQALAFENPLRGDDVPITVPASPQAGSKAPTSGHESPL